MAFGIKRATAAAGAAIMVKLPLLAAIGGHFLPLALVTFGGVNVIIPALHTICVSELHWLGDEQFYDLLALAFAAPGPNMLFVAMIGSHVAGVAGAITATLCLVLPPVTLLAFVSHWWFRARPGRLRTVLQNAVLPATTGVFAAASYLILHAVIHRPLGLAISIVTLVVTLRTRLHPLWMLGLGGLIGAFTQL